MKSILLNELSRQIIDVPRLLHVVTDGKPVKSFFGGVRGYEDIGLFESADNDGNNIIHILANKRVLTQVLPEIFKDAQQICQREKISANPISFLTKLLNTANNSGLTAAHIAIDNNDTAALYLLYQYGINLTDMMYTSQSPIKYIFDINPKFLSKTAAHGPVDLLELICLYAASRKMLKIEHLVDMSMQIQFSNNIKMHTFFLQFFEYCLLDNFVNNEQDREKITMLLDVVANYTKLELSQHHLIEILNLQNPAQNETALINQAKYHILNQCAKAICDNNALPFNDLINTELNDIKTSDKAKKMIELDSNPKMNEVSKDETEIPNTNAIQPKAQEINLVSERIPLQEIDTNQQSDVNSTHESVMISHKQAVDINIYKDKVVTLLKAADKSIAYAEQHLGKNYTDLHFIISILSYLGDAKLGKVLTLAAQILDVKPKTIFAFLQEYVQTLQATDLLIVNNKQKLDAYNLSCAYDNCAMAQLFLTRGIETEIYNQNINSIFETPIANNSTNVLQYLLTKQKLITIDWHFVLYKAIKYANIQAVQYYLESGCDAIDVTTDRTGTIKKGEQYTIYNKILDSLVSLTKIEHYTAQEDRHKAQEHSNKAFAKIPLLCKCLEMMINADKIYISTEKAVMNKTSVLLQKLASTAIALKQNQLAADAVVSLEKLFITLENIGQKITDTNSDMQSQTTYVTHFSIFSDLDHNDTKTLIGVQDEQVEQV